MNKQTLSKTLKTKFPSCASDSSGAVWPEETETVKKLLEGEIITQMRHYIPEIDNYGISYHWETNECVRDGVVSRLIGREVIKPITCFGGRTTLEFTSNGHKILKTLIKRTKTSRIEATA